MISIVRAHPLLLRPAVRVRLSARATGPGERAPADPRTGERLDRLFGSPDGESDPSEPGHRPPTPPIPPSGPTPTAHPTARDGRLTLLLSWADWRPASWVDVLPILLEPLGVTSVRARSAREAERLVRITPIHLAVVDLSLPLDHASPASSQAPADTSAGPRVLEVLRRLQSPPPTVVVKDRHFTRNETRHMHAALNAQAFAVVDRTAADLELMLKVLHRAMDRFYRGRWPGCDGPPTSPPPTA